MSAPVTAVADSLADQVGADVAPFLRWLVGGTLADALIYGAIAEVAATLWKSGT